MRKRIIAGAIAGSAASLAFLALHAIIIVPIWFAALRGLAWGAPGGAFIALALRRTRMGPLAMGLFLWGATAAPSLGNYLLRRGQAPEWLEVAVALATAGVYGLAITRTYGGALAAMAMLAAASGPLVMVTRRGIAIYAALLVVTVTFSAAMAYLLRQFSPSGGSNEANSGDLRVRGGA